MSPGPAHPLRTLVLALCAAWLPSSGARADAAADVQALIAREDLAGALQRTDQALALAPRDARLRFLKAVVLMDLQRNDEALRDFSALSEEYPELPDPHNNIAVLHVRAGRLAQALQALQSALRNDPGHRTARLNLGQVHLMLAVQAWEQAAAGGSLDPAQRRQLDGARALLAPAAPAGR